MLFDTKKFLEQDWQKHARLFRDACPQALSCISATDLLAMARADECESRLVTVDARQKNWRSVHGAFTAAQLKKAQQGNWTLLLQAVDQWIPEVAQLLDLFAFLPRWRLDDVMISLAGRGGGVGPHFDYYDVFLIQASGERRWKIGQRCDEDSPLRPQADMRLLKRFQQQEDHVLKPGDMIYIPAGVAHWGTALTDNCITVSIGFRAVSQRELIPRVAEQLQPGTTEHLRYRDSQASLAADPFCINPSAVNNAEKLWDQLPASVRRGAIARALGVYATEPRYPDHIDPPARAYTDKSLRTLMGKRKLIAHHVASRFAYRETGAKQAELFVNGEVHPCTLAFARLICRQQSLPGTLAVREMALLLQLLNQGSLLVKQ